MFAVYDCLRLWFSSSDFVDVFLSLLLRDAMGSNRLTIMDTTGTARKPNDHCDPVARKHTRPNSIARANNAPLIHMPLRVWSISASTRRS